MVQYGPMMASVLLSFSTQNTTCVAYGHQTDRTFTQKHVP